MSRFAFPTTPLDAIVRDQQSDDERALEVLAGKRYCETHRGWYASGGACSECASGILRLARPILIPPRMMLTVGPYACAAALKDPK